MTGPTWTRRELVTGLAALPVFRLVLGGPIGWDLGGGLGDLIVAHRLVGTLGAPESAACLGSYYLEQARGEQHVSRLVRLLIRDDRQMQRTSRACLDLMESRKKEDFATEDVVVIGGWWLARSEARLCALAALLADA